ncbi:NAD(P)H-binding protein [Nocardia ninae]|uniref:Nucleotide-diphosphate-sugar epimerase n=1 Tax=Nocardia ninae NBRC 108245 TaxID=1210091 RepID=A0A511M8W0_9NOCA|nr:NAD(P)H-binding protein [Nocardia ninae]GEM36568.1 nucleotide-diphosphate-sugar epimerase [Nocardia ninae NBRC 108245]
MILVTGGRGAVATNLLDLLRADDLAVRVGSAHPEQLRVPADVPTVACDLTDPTTFPAALADVTSVFLYAEGTTISEFVTAATEAGVEHIVLLSSSSVLDPDAATNPVAKSHLDAELGLADAPMTVSVLRPGAFAGNARGWAWAIKAGRPISLPYPNAYGDPIHELDIAEAAYTLLTEPGSRGGQYHLTGPETLTFTEQLGRVGQVIGRSIAIDHVTPEAWKQQMAEYIPGHFADGLLAYWRRCDGAPSPITDDVRTLTGRPARTFTSWLVENAALFTG